MVMMRCRQAAEERERAAQCAADEEKGAVAIQVKPSPRGGSEISATSGHPQSNLVLPLSVRVCARCC